MKSKLLLVGVALIFALCTVFSAFGQAASQQAEVMNNESVVKLLRAGMDEDIIIAQIQRSKHNFDVSTDGLIALKKAGASSRLIKFIMDPLKSPAPEITNRQDRPEQEIRFNSANSAVTLNSADDGQSIVINGDMDAIRAVIIRKMIADGYSMQKDDREQLSFDKKMSGAGGITTAIIARVGGNKLQPMMNTLSFLITKQSEKSFVVSGILTSRMLDEARAPVRAKNKKSFKLVRDYLQKFKELVEVR